MKEKASAGALKRYWPAFLPQNALEKLMESYSNPARKYHDLQHIKAVLDGLELLHNSGEKFSLLHANLAAWYHDSVYEGTAEDEQKSADQARLELHPYLPKTDVEEIARLIELTKTHKPTIDDNAGKALCDADLRILSSDKREYELYTKAIRREYDFVNDKDFKAGRINILQNLSKGHIYHTQWAREHWESLAQENIAREIIALSS